MTALPTVIALVAAILLCGLGWIASREVSQAVQVNAQAHVRSNRDAAARALVNQTDDFKLAVETSAATPEVVDSFRKTTAASQDLMQHELSRLVISKGSPWGFLVDTGGRITAMYPAQPALIGKNFAFRDWFKGTARTGRPYVSAAYRAAMDGNPLVVGVTAPVLDGSRRVGYVVVVWKLDSVRALSAGARRDDGVTIIVTDQQGQPVTGTLAFDNRGQATPVDISALTKTALAGRSIDTVSNGMLESAGPVPGLGWTVTATQPASIALAEAGDFRLSLGVTVIVALLLVLLCAVLAWRLSYRRLSAQASAEENRQHIRRLYAASPIGIVEGLPDGTILAVNASVSRMLGYRPSELLEKNTRELIHPDSAPGGDQTHDVTGEAMSSRTSELLYQHRDGSPVPVLVSSIALSGEGGQAHHPVSFVVDQREQKTAAIALKALVDELAEREEFLSTLFDTVDVAVLACDGDGVLTMVNNRERAIHGIGQDAPLEVVQAMHVSHMARLDGRPMAPDEMPLARALAGDEVHDIEYLIVSENGLPARQMLAQATRLTGPGGETVGAVAAAHDVTTTRAAEKAMRNSEERFRRVFDEGLGGKLLTDSAGDIIRVNAVMAHLLATDEGRLVGKPLTEILDNEPDQVSIRGLIQAGSGDLLTEVTLKDTQGRSLFVMLGASWMRESGGERVLLAQFEDITARRIAEQQLTDLALHDALTGLPNRRLLLERCEHAFTRARSGRGASTSIAALFIDLDGFKAINDRAGHDVGDQVLITVANDLLKSLRPADTVARVGGDEFVVLLEREDEPRSVQSVAERITHTVRRRVTANATSLALSASVGIACVDLTSEPDASPELLLRRADTAMYSAKQLGPDRCRVFDKAMQESTEARERLVQTMRDGLRHDRIALVFQPVVDVDTNSILGAEALMRLRNADGLVMPTLPAVIAAEAAGLAEDLGDRILHLALGAASTWPEQLSLAVNISARELTGRDLHKRVERALREFDFDPARLVLEVTESSILSVGPTALIELGVLRKRGVRVAIDDFGTDYATLTNLTTLPVDILKVDTSFTAGLPHKRTHTAIVNGIASIACELGIPCIIEGVETQAQLAAIRGMSVQAQGLIWGEPRGPGSVPGLDRLPAAGGPPVLDVGVASLLP